jgi:hypothetical protein
MLASAWETDGLLRIHAGNLVAAGLAQALEHWEKEWWPRSWPNFLISRKMCVPRQHPWLHACLALRCTQISWQEASSPHAGALSLSRAFRSLGLPQLIEAIVSAIWRTAKKLSRSED